MVARLGDGGSDPVLGGVQVTDGRQDGLESFAGEAGDRVGALAVVGVLEFVEHLGFGAHRVHRVSRRRGFAMVLMVRGPGRRRSPCAHRGEARGVWQFPTLASTRGRDRRLRPACPLHHQRPQDLSGGGWGRTCRLGVIPVTAIGTPCRRSSGGGWGEVVLTRAFTRPATSSAAMAVSGWGEVAVVRCSRGCNGSTSKKRGNVGEPAPDKYVHLVIHRRGGCGRTTQARPRTCRWQRESYRPVCCRSEGERLR